MSAACLLGGQVVILIGAGNELVSGAIAPTPPPAHAAKTDGQSAGRVLPRIGPPALEGHQTTLQSPLGDSSSVSRRRPGSSFSSAGGFCGLRSWGPIGLLVGISMGGLAK